MDPHAYVGDKSGALWSGLAKEKGNAVKKGTLSDAYHMKQDIRRHVQLFNTVEDQKKIQNVMTDACNAPTSIQADVAEKAFHKLISKRSNNPTKINNFKNWWWR